MTTGTDIETLGKSYYINVRVKIDDDLSDAQKSRLIDYVVGTGWATDIGHKPYGLRLRVISSQPVNVQQALADLDVDSTPAPHDDSFVLITSQALNDKWGNWPSKAPAW